MGTLGCWALITSLSARSLSLVAASTDSLSPLARGDSGDLRDDVEVVFVGHLLLQQQSQGVLDMNNVHGIRHRDIQQYNNPKGKHKLQEAT